MDMDSVPKIGGSIKLEFPGFPPGYVAYVGRVGVKAWWRKVEDLQFVIQSMVVHNLREADNQFHVEVIVLRPDGTYEGYNAISGMADPSMAAVSLATGIHRETLAFLEREKLRELQPAPGHSAAIN